MFIFCKLSFVHVFKYNEKNITVQFLELEIIFSAHVYLKYSPPPVKQSPGTLYYEVLQQPFLRYPL